MRLLFYLLNRITASNQNWNDSNLIDENLMNEFWRYILREVLGYSILPIWYSITERFLETSNNSDFHNIRFSQYIESVIVFHSQYCFEVYFFVISINNSQYNYQNRRGNFWKQNIYVWFILSFSMISVSSSKQRLDSSH